MATPSCPVPDCHKTVDLVFESSDGTQFGVHAENLEAFAAGFPPASFALREGNQLEVVKLERFGDEALPLFLQFMHHVDQPDLQEQEFWVVMQIAYGAEKYCVYSAKQVCRAVIRNRIEGGEVEALIFFARHGYAEDANLVAKRILTHFNKWKRDKPIKRSLNKAGHSRISHAWTTFLDGCKKEALAATREPRPVQHKRLFPECTKWRKFCKDVLKHQHDDPINNCANLSTYIEGQKYQLQDCKWCRKRADNWSSWEGIDSLSIKFSDFL